MRWHLRWQQHFGVVGVGIDVVVVTTTEDKLPGGVCGSGDLDVIDVTSDDTLPVVGFGSHTPSSGETICDDSGVSSLYMGGGLHGNHE